MKIYIAGPMAGIPKFNYPAFTKAAALYRSKGWTVCSPHEYDIARHGKDISKGNTTGSVEQAEKEHGFNLRDALKFDLSWICDSATAIAMLPGWERSYGSRAEHALAVALKLEIHYL